MPQIEDVLNDLQQSAYLTTLDMASGNWKVHLDSSFPISAFCTADGLYEFFSMPIGLKESPAVFQRLMQQVLEGLCPHRAISFFG